MLSQGQLLDIWGIRSAQGIDHKRKFFLEGIMGVAFPVNSRRPHTWLHLALKFYRPRGQLQATPL